MSDDESEALPSDPAPSIVDDKSLPDFGLLPTPSDRPLLPGVTPTHEIAIVLVIWFFFTFVAIFMSGAIQEGATGQVASTRLGPTTVRWGSLVLYTPLLTAFTCASLYLAFGGYSLLIRFGTGLIVAGLAIAFALGVVLVLSGGIGSSQTISRPFVALSYSMMGAGALLSIARFAGWSIRRHRSPQTSGSQFSIVQILQLTLICALGFGATKWVELKKDDWQVIGIIVVSIIGLSLGITFLIIDRWSATARTIATMLLGGVLLVALWSCITFLTKARRFDLPYLVLPTECYLLAFNFMAMVCFVLRARGYRLMRQKSAVNGV